MLRKRKIKTIKSPGIIVPAPGMALRCPKGHVNSWDARVIAASGTGKFAIVSVRCSVCGFTIKVGKNRIMEGSGWRSDKKTGVPLTTPAGSEHNGGSERTN